MKLDSIRIVLVATSHPGNIGSAARAMKTMGLSKLYLVKPQVFPHMKAIELAAGAADILENAIITNNLQEALAGCRTIMATSARPRELSLPGLLPAEGAKKIALEPDDSQVAIVFGRESTGLSNAELLQCHYHIYIPGNPVYTSLNLAQAVQIIAYELRMKVLDPACKVEYKPDLPAKSEDLENFMTHLKEVLIEIEFLKPEKPRKLMERLRRLFTRIHLEEMEVRLLRGILSQIQSSLKESDL